MFATLQREERETVSGADVFDMYQTHGFPPELFETLATEHTWDSIGKASMKR